MAYKHSAEVREKIRIAKLGDKNPRWKGDAVGDRGKVGRLRALRWFKPESVCESCGKSARTDRHHKDKDPMNNHPSNIQRLCRHCHMAADGRLEKFLACRLKKGGANGREE